MSEDLQLKKAFFLESSEILERLEREVESMEGAAPDEAVHAVFRGLHTIKGNSSFLNLEGITRLSHGAETILDKVRRKEMAVSAPLMIIVRRVFRDLRRMIVDQDLALDVSRPIDVMKKFLTGDHGAVKELGNEANAPVGQAVSTAKIQTGNFVRVDENKVSKILSLASELEILRYGLELMPEKMDSLGAVAADLRFELDLKLTKLSRITRSLSSIVFGVRLIPVNQVFQRFPRVVTELGRKLGKQIKLQIVNGDAELDKNIVEAIADPLTHLIRNSADHGIEPATERIRLGKNPQGTIKLNSYVRGNFVFIEISDDGRGIDGDKILRKAVEKGIIPSERAGDFTDSQKLGLIFAPGFSTADTVTDISGRGVGMDVVKSNINQLKGTVLISSDVGRGTVIQLRFPMSMVVILSLFVDVGETKCAIPVDQIDESLDFFSGEMLNQPPAGAQPEEYLAVYSIRSLLWKKSAAPSARASYHTIRFRERPDAVFLVEDFSSIEEAIVQSVDSYIAALPGLQGATVRKDGTVALVLNSQNIIELAQASQPYAYVRRKSALKTVEAEANLSDFLAGVKAS